jgi:Spy/CpxP family protein refolding chaperone
MRFGRPLIVFIACVLATAVARGMEADKPDLRPPLWAMFHWSSNPAVQDELRVSVEQREKLARLTSEYRAASVSPDSRKRGELSPEEREKLDTQIAKRRATVERDYRPKIESLLNAAQQQRLSEIHLQSLVWLNGPGGAGRTPIAQAIGLSNDQKEMLAQIEFEWIRSLSGLKLLATPEERKAKETADIQKRNAASDTVLTPEQKQRLTELCGNPFDIPGAIALFPKPARMK